MIVISIKNLLHIKQIEDYFKKNSILKSIQIAIEYRIDLFKDFCLSNLQESIKNSKYPVIFTLRPVRQGGECKLPEQDRIHTIKELAKLNPDYLDIEYDVPISFLLEINNKYPKIKIIRSFHNFENTPSDVDLLNIINAIEHPIIFGYKIATYANSILDSLRIMSFVLECKKNNFTCIAMGEYGEITRILSSIIGNQLTYCSVNDNDITAKGQLSFVELIEKYNFNKLNKLTTIYGIIGYPVSHSVSKDLHNNYFKKYSKNSIFINIPLHETELDQFVKLIRNTDKLNFSGLCVTYPHKNSIIAHLDDVMDDAKILGVIGVMHIDKSGKFTGYNFDGIGALDAIEKHCKINGKTMLIIGASKTARSIIFESIRRGIKKIIVLNRTKETAQQLAKEFNCVVGGGFDDVNQYVKNGYDIIINATSAGLKNETISILNEDLFINGKYAFDVNYRPRETSFLNLAKSKHCKCIYGDEMIYSQIELVQNIWNS